MQIIRGYELGERIGEGGFAHVYRAHQPSIGRDVAIKVIKSDFASNPEFIDKFNHEAALIGRLEHPFIVPLYDFWHDDTGAYLAMRWMQGGSLRDYLKENRCSLDTIIQWLDQISNALSIAHHNGIVHRDIKPENILLDQHQNAYLADFGIAKDTAISPTQQTENPLTPLYAAPEQFANDPITPVTDIYALGIMIYELIEGKPPFEGSLTHLVYSHLHDTLPPLDQTDHDLPDSIYDVLAKATAKLPEDRYLDALELFNDFRDSLTQPVIEVKSPALITSNPFFNRGPIRDTDYFFGRVNEVRQLNSLIRNGQSVSIIGQRRIGKTSLMYHIMNETGDTLATDEQGVNYIFLDCGALITLDQSEIYRALLEEIEDALYDADVINESFPILSQDKPIRYREFERTLRWLFRKIDRLVLLMDEFELLSRNSYLESGFFTGLRALAMRYPITYVTASKEPLLELTYADESTLSSPFFNIFAMIRLGLFTEDVVQIMLSTLSQKNALTLSPDLIEHIFTLSGGHPLFTQIAGYHALELLQQDTLDLAKLIQQFREAIHPHLDYYWRSLTSDQQRVLLTLSSAQYKETEIVRELQHACLVKQIENDEVDYLSSILHEHVMKQTVSGFLHAEQTIIDETHHQVLCYGQTIDTTPTQFDLLRVFVTQPDQVITTEELEHALWGETFVEDPERLKSVIKGLRRALGDYADHIENSRGVGYRWRLTL